MPELPEVEVVRSGLAPWVTGRTVESVEVLDRRSLRRHDGPFEHALAGATLSSPVRRGKFLWFGLGEDRALVAHLGMSGQILLADETAPLPRHTRVVFTFADSRGEDVGGRHNQMRFVDQRIFGGFHIQPLVPTADGGPGGHGDTTPLIPPAAAHIARDPLDPLFDPEAVVARMRKRRTDIKRALLDQGLVSGIGNIYADEALFRARVHYLAPTDRTRPSRLRAVLDAAEEVMREALAQGGTSFDALYINVNGESGYFERRLDVYGREGLPCRVCGTPIVRESFMNRSSHFCPVCQKRPRRAPAVR